MCSLLYSEILQLCVCLGLCLVGFLGKDIKKFKWKFVTVLVEDVVSELATISKHKALHVG